jgi:hypothetical protein
MKQVKPLTYTEAKYLKHAGPLIDAKVSIHIRDGRACIHIGDFEFDRFESALRFLQESSRAICHEPFGFEAI